jgi:hypothetical protein
MDYMSLARDPIPAEKLAKRGEKQLSDSLGQSQADRPVNLRDWLDHKAADPRDVAAADLAGSEHNQMAHIAEAIQYGPRRMV